MLKIIASNKIYLYIIPVFIVLWGVFVNYFSGPFFLNRIDPEFPYLLNGLNVAYPDFARIGHTDHPGTPFQLFTGILIRIIYWISGSENIVESVISDPELYLLWSSILLTIITALIVLIIGKVVYKNSGSLFGSFILQSTLFLNIVLIEVFSRYNPDRALIIYTLFFVIVCYKFLYQEKFSSRKMALYSGIIMGLGFITKVSYLPMLIIPFILISSFKNRLLYIGTFIIVSFILLLPVLNRFNDIYHFVIGMATHDGLYGKGDEQIINIDSFLRNLYLILIINISFCVILILSIRAFIRMMIKRELRIHHYKEFLLLLAFILCTLISILLVAKHFKNYYLAPVLTMAGIMFYVFWKLNEKIKYSRLIFTSLLIVLVGISIFYFAKKVPYGIINNQAIEVSRIYFEDHIPPNSYLLIESTWNPAPFIENGLVYGNVYVRYSYKYYRDYKKVYPNVYTYEGRNLPLKYFNMINVNTEAILKSGQEVFIYSNPLRNSGEIIAYLKDQAYKANIELAIDTVFHNDYNKEFFIKVKNASNWRIINNQKCGFEKHDVFSLLTDDELNPVHGNYKFDSIEVYRGLKSVVLDSIHWFSPKFKLYNIVEGDYIEVAIKIKTETDNEDWSLGVSSEKPYLDDFYYLQRESVGYITDQWQIVRLSFTVPKQPADSIVDVFFQYNGKEEIYLDDFEVTHFSDK